MKIKHTIIIFAVGICLTIIGALFKIMHWPFAGMILTVSSILEVIGIILLIYKLLTHTKFKDFLNW
ncbi:MAG: hypothetical protein LBN27_11855 [Prevotellaceae bacterium]|jgi:hypothetical protein|nr:hypothetical protein [Prevotellaceae bacterium]